MSGCDTSKDFTLNLSFVFKVTGSRVVGETDRHARAADDEKDACDLEVMSQSLILPPTDRPYFLLLQGYDQSKARHAAQPYHTTYPDIIPCIIIITAYHLFFHTFGYGIEHTAQNS